MPTNSQGSRRFRLLGAVLGVALLGAVGLGVKFLASSGTHPTAPVSAVPAAQPVATNVVSTQPPPPGTAVSAEEVLDKLDQWNAAHPNWHSIFTTSFPNGSTVSKMDIFSYLNQTNSGAVKFEGQIFNPPLEFIGERENGKMLFYFPRDSKLVQMDIKRDAFFLPGPLPNLNRVRDLLKQAKSSFAEASEDLEVVTLAIDGREMNLTNMIYFSLRIKNDGELIGMGVQVQDQNILTSIQYLSFDRDAVIHDSPVVPLGLIAETNTTLVQAMMDEINSLRPKPLRPRTI